MEYYWLVQALAYWSLAIFIIPYKYIRKLLLFSFLGGFVYTWIVQYVGVQVLNLWRYKSAFFIIYEIPFFFVMSWFAATLLYGYLLINYSDYQIYILSFFVFWTTMVNYFPQQEGVFSMTNWSLSLTLMFAIFSHVFLLYFLKWINNIEELGTKEDLFNLK